METTKNDVKMYMATIKGWTEVTAFSVNKETAKDLAIQKKAFLCRDDIEYFDTPKWTWENVENYYGANVEEITDGTVIWDR